MEHETENKEAEKFQPVNYQEKIAQQTEIVKKLTASHKKNPSAETSLRNRREGKSERTRPPSRRVCQNDYAQSRRSANRARRINLRVKIPGGVSEFMLKINSSE
jgi:hypothetical protein